MTPTPDSPREVRGDMASALRMAAQWIENTLIEAPDEIAISNEGQIEVKFFLDDGPRIRSIIEGVGFPTGAKWEVNQHGMFLRYDNIHILIYTDNRSVWLPSHQLLAAFLQED